MQVRYKILDNFNLSAFRKNPEETWARTKVSALAYFAGMPEKIFIIHVYGTSWIDRKRAHIWEFQGPESLSDDARFHWYTEFGKFLIRAKAVAVMSIRRAKTAPKDIQNTVPPQDWAAQGYPGAIDSLAVAMEMRHHVCGCHAPIVEGRLGDFIDEPPPPHGAWQQYLQPIQIDPRLN